MVNGQLSVESVNGIKYQVCNHLDFRRFPSCQRGCEENRRVCRVRHVTLMAHASRQPRASTSLGDGAVKLKSLPDSLCRSCAYLAVAVGDVLHVYDLFKCIICVFPETCPFCRCCRKNSVWVIQTATPKSNIFTNLHWVFWKPQTAIKDSIQRPELLFFFTENVRSEETGYAGVC